MNKDALAGLLILSPLFGLFAIFLGALYFRGRYNKAHPEAERTPAQRLRGKVIGAALYAVIFAACAYVALWGDRFAPSWTVTFYVGLGAFVLGEAFGRRNALRQVEGKSPPTEPVVFF